MHAITHHRLRRLLLRGARIAASEGESRGRMARRSVLACLAMLVVALAGCGQTAGTAVDQTAFTRFADDLAFLREHGDVQLLRAPGGGVVALSADYQGRVMTSAVSEEGVSAGYVNRAFIEAGRTGTQFDNFGGEDRFWLGPEGGQYGIYFPPGAEFNLDAWQVPQEMQTGQWTITARSDTSVTYTRSMAVTNYGGVTYELDVERTVRLLPPDELGAVFGAPVPPDADWVAFETINRVTNAGAGAWTPETGQPSIWILCMYSPFETSWVVVPFEGPGTDDAISSYFGDIPSERLEIRDGYALFKADGAYRSKIGVAPQRAREVLGSFSPQAELLTLVQFDLPANETRYVNSQWEIQNEPYGGDVVNAYNDGPPGAGGFYEMESSSPALDLAPGESYTHRHRTLHVTGARSTIDALATQVLGVSATTMAEGI